MAVADLTKVLDAAGASYEVLHHERTERALSEALALGVAPDEVAKTLIVTAPSGHVRVVLPASRRVDMRKLADAIDEPRKSLHFASEEEMARYYPEFELGAVPPIGGMQEDRVVVDAALARQESVVLEAGSHDDSVRVRVEDLLRVSHAEVAGICSD